MKCLLFNLPYPVQVTRRYMCSYNSGQFLFPPLELMYLGSILKERKKDDAFLLDAVAEKLDINAVRERIKESAPDLLITLIGFETFQEDIENINTIKEGNPSLKIISFGHYPTVFPEEILNNSKIDIIIRGEPENTLLELYDSLSKNGSDISNIDGLAYKQADSAGVLVNKPRDRIRDLDALPFPDYSLIKMEKYNEPFMDRPFAVIQSSRGCPFGCRYCVRTYGRELIHRSVGNILNEIEQLIAKYKIRSIRFIDDTFTVEKTRVIQICKGIIDRGFKFKWSCLSRADTIDSEMVSWMSRAGCARILIGIESGSQKLLDYYGKNYTLGKIESVVGMIRRKKIECVGWFIVGAPAETEDDFKKSIALAKKIKFDFIAVSRLCLYPGTQLFEGMKNYIEFSLFPYKNSFKDRDLEFESVKREKIFYRSFYLSPSYMLRAFKLFFKNPRKTMLMALSLVNFIIEEKNNNKERRDLL